MARLLQHYVTRRVLFLPSLCIDTGKPTRWCPHCHTCAGTGGLNVPMFIALRRFTLLTTILLERVLYAKSHDRSTYSAVSLMIIGARTNPAQLLSAAIWCVEGLRFGQLNLSRCNASKGRLMSANHRHPHQTFLLSVFSRTTSHTIMGFSSVPLANGSSCRWCL